MIETIQQIQGLAQDAPKWLQLGIKWGPTTCALCFVGFLVAIKWERVNPKLLKDAQIERELKILILRGDQARNKLERSSWFSRYTVKEWCNEIRSFVTHYLPEHRRTLQCQEAEAPPIYLAGENHAKHNEISALLRGARKILEKRFNVTMSS